MDVILNKWFYLIVPAMMMGYFYASDPDSITNGSIVITTLLAFIGFGVVERLDVIINKKGTND